jgi:hypothetical protein
VALEVRVAPLTALKHLGPLGTRIPGILPTDQKRKSGRLQAKVGNLKAALLSLEREGEGAGRKGGSASLFGGLISGLD